MDEQKQNEIKTENTEELREGVLPQLENRFRITIWNRLVVLIKWLVFAALTGIALGLVGTALGKGVSMATAFRMEHPWILYGLPFAGVLIVWMYQWERKQERSSTNMVLDAIHAEREIPLKTAPLIFISTILTHLFGGSAGREGAALQLGGSIGNFLGLSLIHI